MARADKIRPEDRLLDRLARVEGQVRALRKMLEEHRDCPEVLTQLRAARSGLESAGAMIVDRHLTECVLEGESVSPQAMARLREALKLFAR
jgi:CsoR family transcriptional regulator, copper-sensing transcriptional repressor